MKIAAALFDLDGALADTLAVVETGSPAGVVKAEAIGRLLDGWVIDRSVRRGPMALARLSWSRPAPI